MNGSVHHLGRRLLVSVTGSLIAVGFALAAWRIYQPPNLAGFTNGAPWLEPDFLCSVASASSALAVGLWARDTRSAAVRPFGALLRALSWFALTGVLFAVWAHAVFLLTLVIAPSHAFAGLRVATLWRNWQADRVWRRGR